MDTMKNKGSFNSRTGRKAGIIGGRALVAKYGSAVMSQRGKLGALKRWNANKKQKTKKQ